MKFDNTVERIKLFHWDVSVYAFHALKSVTLFCGLSQNEQKVRARPETNFDCVADMFRH